MQKTRKSEKLLNFALILIAAVSVIVIGGFAIYNVFFTRDEFYSGTTINGVAVGGLNVEEATNVIQTDFDSSINDISVTLKYDNEEWTFTSKDFEAVDDFSELIANAYQNINSQNFFDRRLKYKEFVKNDKKINISYRNMLGGFAEKLDFITREIEQELQEPQVVFNATKKQSFEYLEGQDEITVDRIALEELIDASFLLSKNISVEVPVVIRSPEKTVEDLKKYTALRSEFSTNYSNSTKNRKSNVVRAITAFNGKVIMPNEEVSFNQTTGLRTKENGYKPANIILNGVYIEGSGGGVCQASTTLYNALILANLEILEVNKHSLPASYVPLAFDAMVSEGISDLRFKNNTDSPIYIKTWGDDKNVFVKIYGEEHQNGEYYKTRSEFIKSIPHLGDRIVADNGDYSHKVTFKGEYLRLKYPQEGYEANAYLQRYSANGELLEEILIRHEIYQPQEGVIIEGVEELYDGITLPDNDVKFIPPQGGSKTNSGNVQNIISGNNHEKYNP